VEAALQASEATYRTLFETVPQGVVYQDATGAITSANPAALRIL
jgi:PAS domain S-box-containing protein